MKGLLERDLLLRTSNDPISLPSTTPALVAPPFTPLSTSLPMLILQARGNEEKERKKYLPVSVLHRFQRRCLEALHLRPLHRGCCPPSKCCPLHSRDLHHIVDTTNLNITSLIFDPPPPLYLPPPLLPDPQAPRCRHCHPRQLFPHPLVELINRSIIFSTKKEDDDGMRS